MKLLNNLKIVYKALLALAVMAAFALGATWYTANKLVAIDTLYSNLLDHEVKVALWLEDANVALLNEARILNRMVAERGNAGMREAQGKLQNLRRKIAERLTDSARALPAITDGVRVAEAAFAKAVETSTEIGRAKLAGDDETALHELGERHVPALTEARRLLRH